MSSILSEVVLQDVEEKFFAKLNYKPDIYVRYVDDTLIVWNHSKKEQETFKNKLSSVYESIDFIIEYEENGCILYLDILFQKNKAKIETTVYRKPTFVPAIIYGLAL